MRKLIVMVPVAVMMLCAAGVQAAGNDVAKKETGKESAVKQEFRNHFKLYGFIRNYFTYDSRESVSGTANLFYYLPKDHAFAESGEDLNRQDIFGFVALTSRVGMDVSGYQVGKTHFGAKIEADFYAGLSGSTGTATMRLRQAYATIGWKDLPMSGDSKAAVTLKVGQAWHPMAADQPEVLGLNAGNPFNPFSRTPQVTMDASLGEHFVISASALWQMQYTSTGPSGASANYIKYGGFPELYAGLTFKTKSGLLMRLGADVLSIRPRLKETKTVPADPANPDSEKITKDMRKVSDRITTMSPYFYIQYKHKSSFSIKAKTVYGSAGEHMNLMSGYGVTAKYTADGEDGHYEYAPLHSSSSWMSISYGKKVQGVLFAGYYKNLGASEKLVNTNGVTNASDFWFSKNGFQNMTQMYRITPTVYYNLGKFVLGLEYEMTSVEYGDKKYNAYGLATEGLHWITNHRVQLMFKFNF